MKKTLVIASLMLACPVLADQPTRLSYVKDAVITTLAYVAAGAGLGHIGPVGSSLGAKIGLGLGLVRNISNAEMMLRTPKTPEKGKVWSKKELLELARKQYGESSKTDQEALEKLLANWKSRRNYEYWIHQAPTLAVPIVCTVTSAICAAVGTYFSGNWIVPCGLAACTTLDSIQAAYNHWWDIEKKKSEPLPEESAV